MLLSPLFNGWREIFHEITIYWSIYAQGFVLSNAFEEVIESVWYHDTGLLYIVIFSRSELDKRLCDAFLNPQCSELPCLSANFMPSIASQWYLGLFNLVISIKKNVRGRFNEQISKNILVLGTKDLSINMLWDTCQETESSISSFFNNVRGVCH